MDCVRFEGRTRPFFVYGADWNHFDRYSSKNTSFLFTFFGLKSKESKVTEDEIISIVNEAKEEGEVFTWNTFKFEVSDMDGVRIDKFIVSRIMQ